MRATITTGIDGTLRVVARRLRDEIDDLVATMLARMRDEAPDFDTASRPELADGLRESCYGNIRAALGALGDDRQPPRHSPAEAVDVARATARAGIALEPLLHTYRIGHAVVLERFFALIEELDLTSAQRHSATLIGSKYLFAYVDRVVGEVSAEYATECQRVSRSSIQRRVQLVRDVLGGATVDGTELGYRLEQEHLAVVATGPAADASLRDLARRLERQLLTVAMTDDTVWAWLGSTRRHEPSSSRVDPWSAGDDRTRYAVGEPARGISGFRDSHEQALAAHRVARHLPALVTHYDDVALEAALLHDVHAARHFVDRELGPLTASDARTRLLRETLGCYLRSGLNAAATAAVLHVSDRTIAYRIRSIEEMLGRSVLSRSGELAAAVRVHRVLYP
ncbi:helix-turn-helix domain-containing protein [Actinomycetospora endophytica]|uniref:Helix-turn-helix domain-containing protein n=1 Tax=Actinomycetospora endophytica TaxID=2291215 RepID=A0ABS8PIU3_9PSEU|nr:helix-turn-helix domain-containing protein [Actinomycetospora endophytica]MCD2198171.1 helix-turn-helix domain-containing protein [Actinomycetospora endophytica]